MCDITKECPVCKTTIDIDIYNIHDIARVRSVYYHTKCLDEYANKMVKREKHAAIWDDVVKNISGCEKEAKEIIYKRYWQDKLNEHLNSHYDIMVMPERFWEMVVQLNNGLYKGKKCKPISIDTLYGAWCWGQKKLDSINRQNKQNKKGPKTDTERLPYDLAILVQHIPDYLKYKAKCDAEEAEREAQKKEKIKIDYNKVNTSVVKTEGLDDISDMLDEI